MAFYFYVQPVSGGAIGGGPFPFEHIMPMVLAALADFSATEIQYAAIRDEASGAVTVVRGVPTDATPPQWLVRQTSAKASGAFWLTIGVVAAGAVWFAVRRRR
jgi:hypothetical protein